MSVNYEEVAARLRAAGELSKKGEYAVASAIFRSVPIMGLTNEQALAAGAAHFHAGVSRGSRDDFRHAIRVFRYLLEKTRKNGGSDADVSDVWCWLARSYGYLAKHSNSVIKLYAAFRSRRCARRALRHNPEHAFSYYVLARWHAEMPAWAGGDLGEAMSFVDQAVRIQPARIMFRYARAKFNLKRAHHESAHEELTLILEMPEHDMDDGRRKREAAALLEEPRPA